MQLVREGRTNELGYKHNSSISMKKTLNRPGFVENMGESVHEARFDLSDKFDKSTYLSKFLRPKSLVPFEGFKAREEDLIAKGGDRQVDLGGKSMVFYNSDVKLT